MGKRLLDLLGSTVGLLIFSPILIILAIAIKLDSKGPVFYMQERIGKGGLPFKLFKFRSMYTGADKKGLLTVGGKDNRVTKVGYFIRKYKFDEIPQFLNVFFGDMSLVGPRPEVKKYTDLYNSEQREVLNVKPGMTDYASIEYRNENDVLAASADPEKTYIEEIMPHKLELNKKYISEAGLFTDIKILFITFKTIFFK